MWVHVADIGRCSVTCGVGVSLDWYTESPSGVSELEAISYSRGDSYAESPSEASEAHSVSYSERKSVESASEIDVSSFAGVLEMAIAQWPQSFYRRNREKVRGMWHAFHVGDFNTLETCHSREVEAPNSAVEDISLESRLVEKWEPSAGRLSLMRKLVPEPIYFTCRNKLVVIILYPLV
jgi:hypothetical protein